MSGFKFTRQQYMDRECTHREYNAQFVTAATKEKVLRYIPLGHIILSTDEHFNDIPLRLWDKIPMERYAGDWVKVEANINTLSMAVCINKEAARQIKEDCLRAIGMEKADE
jgi:hypothetical protein